MQETPANPSGVPEDSPVVESPDEEPKPTPSNSDMVSYDTHRKLLGEKKKWKERAEALEQQARDRAESDLEEQQKWKELAEHRGKEATEARNAYEKLESELSEGRKLSALLDALPAPVERKYWGLIDTTKVVFNPDTGEVESSSVQAVAKEIQETYPEILRATKAPGQPAQSPASAPAGNLTLEQWKKLPYKERIERKGEINFG